jgi:hypothetical protein
MKKPSELLKEAADLVEPPGRWIQEVIAQDEDGEETSVSMKPAVCWCAWGAIDETIRRHRAWGQDAFGFMERTVGGPIGPFNDSHSQPEVVAALRKAAELAESEGM